DDEGHTAIPENRSSRYARDLLVVRFQILHDHLMLADEMVHKQRETDVLHLQDDGDGARDFLFGIGHVEDFVQGHQRQIVSTHLQYFFGFRNGVDLLLRGLQGLRDVAQRQDEGFIAHTYRHAVEDGQGERKHDADGGTLARLGKDLNVATHALNI